MTFNIFFLIGIAILTTFLIWNIIESKKIRSLLSKHKNSTESGFDKYLDLKYQIQLIITIGAILSFLIGYLGFDTRESLLKQSTEGIEEISILKNQRDSTQKLLDSTVSNVKFLNLFIEEVFKVKIPHLEKSLSSINTDASILKNEIKKLSKEISLPKIYIFEDMKLISNGNQQKTVYFSSLPKATNGQILPTFKTAPSISVPFKGSVVRILKVTKDYFVYEHAMNIANATTDKYDLWLVSYE